MEHDMREGGIQVLKDSQNNVQLTIEWLKVPGGHHGGSWAARVKGVPMKLGEGLLFHTAIRLCSNIYFIQTSQCASPCFTTLA